MLTSTMLKISRKTWVKSRHLTGSLILLFYLTDVCYKTLYKIRNPPFWHFSYISVQLISYIQCTCIHIPEMYHCGSNCYVCVYADEYKIIYSSVATFSSLLFFYQIHNRYPFICINKWMDSQPGFFHILIQYQKKPF